MGTWLNINAEQGLLGLFLFFILGIIFGSFLNSLIYRLGQNISLVGRSFCPACKKILGVFDLIPLFSFIFLKNKCRYCGQKIGWQYFLVELATGLLFALTFWQHQAIDLLLFRNLFFVLVLIFIFVFDWKYYLILDRIIWPALAAALILNILSSKPQAPGTELWAMGLGLLIGAGFFGIQYLISKGKWIGLGDVKFGALLGVMFGWQLTILVIILAYVIGGLVASILLISRKKNFGEVLPMGTFLAISGVIAMLFGQQILTFYFNLLGV
ncbi:MAG: prepilin peptidase [Patescibacteria group bacterium]|nr:prepilin peptidase [Patescibacteria group bacterium]